MSPTSSTSRLLAALAGVGLIAFAFLAVYFGHGAAIRHDADAFTAWACATIAAACLGGVSLCRFASR